MIGWHKEAGGSGEGGQQQPTRENNKPAHVPACPAKAAAIAGEAPFGRVPHVGALDQPQRAVPVN